MPNLARIEEEVRMGLPHESDRLETAMRNLEFSMGDFSRAPVRPPSGAYDQKRFPRHSLLLKRVAQVLSMHLYKSGPARNLPDHPKAAEWLEAIYRKHLVDALFQKADRLTCINDVAMFQVSGSDDPECPVYLDLWDSSQFCVWVHPDKPKCPVAVALIDRYDEQRRVRLWTVDEVSTWVSEKLKPGQTANGRLMSKIAEEPNPYGILPFVWIHFDLPTCDFWTGGPGNHLADVNDGLNYFLTEHYDCIRFNTRPVIVGKNVRSGWRPPSPLQPGDYWDLPSEGGDAAGPGENPPTAEYLQADVSFVGAGWDDFNEFLRHTLEMEGVPETSIRLEQTAAQSGYAIVVEQIPLILWAQTRQRPFGYYEDCLAKTVLTVGAAGWAGTMASETELAAAAADPGLTLHWPDMFPDLPGPERDTADSWLLDNGLASRIEILMRRYHLTREEAEERLAAVAADLKAERELLADAQPDPGESAAERAAREKAEADAAKNPDDESDDPEEDDPNE